MGGTALAAPAGQILVNRAEASHDVAGGASLTTVSNTVSTLLPPVSGVALTPDEAVVSGFVSPAAGIVRLFTLTNLANRDDSFRITAAGVTAPASLTAIYFDLNASGVLDAGDAPVTIGATSSPVLSPGGSLGVLVVYSAIGLASGSLVNVSLACESLLSGSVNGLATDGAVIRDQVGGGAIFSDPAAAGQPPLKTADGAARTTAARGTEVQFEIAFANSGTATAANVVLSDPLPTGLAYVPGTLALDGIPLTDGADADAGEASAGSITVRWASVAPGETHRVAFRCRVDMALAPGLLLVNTATLSADGLAAVGTTRAEVLEDPFGVLFQAGSNLPVPGTAVRLFADASGSAPCPIPVLSGTGAPPNVDNQNPFASDASGRYTFLPDPTLLDSPGETLTCYLVTSQSGYLNRLVRLDAVASAATTASAPVYTLTLTPLDNLPLAPPGGFSAVPGPVVLPDVSVFGFNLPLFPAGTLALIKTADRSHAQVGEAIGYRLRLFNAGAVPLNAVTVTDLIPEFTDPVEGAARRITSAGDASMPFSQSGRNLTFDAGTLGPGEAVEIAYRLRIAPGAPAAAVENRAMASGTQPNGEVITAGPARSVVFVRQGIFSFQQFLIGRVYEDSNQDGEFNGDDRGIPGVRVVLDNGMTSTTDENGLYSLPSVPEEARMIGLDPVSYPPGYCPVDEEHRSQHGASRLLRTPLGGGTLLKQNFILAKSDACAPPPRNEPTPPAADVTQAESVATDTAPLDPQRPIRPDEESLHPQEHAAPGTYVSEQVEVLPPVREGAVRVLEPPDGSVATSGGLSLKVRTHRLGSVRVSVNDRIVSDEFLAQKELDDRNQLATFQFSSVPLLPGPNQVRVDALFADGDAGEHVELTVFGRGAATALVITPARDTLPADGRSSAEVVVTLVDDWGNPAQDARVRLQTSAGTFHLEGSTGIDRDVALMTRDGRASAVLVAPPATGRAELSALSGELAGQSGVTFLPAPHPPLLVGVAEGTVTASHEEEAPGKDPATPEQGTHGRVAFFYKGPAFPGTLLTTAYDSDQRLNRTTDTNRLFDLDPLLETYPVMGDSSFRYQETLSNSRAYLKLEKERSFLMYGDFQPDMDDGKLAGYSRKLTGTLLNLENETGDRLSLAIARPDNAFARELIPGAGISGLYRLQHSPILPGSETVAVEIHDRRNPEEVLARQILLRGIDYDLDPLAGTLLFKRPIDAFAGSEFDLVEVVVIYEFQTLGFESMSWTGRGQKGFAHGATRLGFSAIGEDQDGGDDFRLFAADLTQRLPGAGRLDVELARSDGVPLNLGNSTAGIGSSGAGLAARLELSERIEAIRGGVRLSYSDVDEDFVNPYGSTVTPGSRRITLATDSGLAERVRLGVALQDEENQTATVDNSRTTAAVKVTGTVSDQLSLLGGLDHRDFKDDISDERSQSNLLSAGVTYTPVPKWKLAVRREQNLTSESDPSYPNSTFLTASYQQNLDLRYFLKFRDSSAPIAAIADLSVTGLNPPRSKTEMQLGAESRLGSYSTLTSRYQINSGIEGTDSFAVLGLSSRFPVSDTLSVDARGEAGFHAAGPGESFQSISTGVSWLPVEDFRATLRYELRNMDGLGQTLAGGAVGKPTDDLTLLARVEVSDASQNGQDTTLVDILTGAAVRPLARDDFGLLFAWRHRDQRQGSQGPGNQVRVLTDTLSTDAVFQLTPKVRFFGRGALTYSHDEPLGLPIVATTTTLAQARLEYRFRKYFDLAGEGRNVMLWQESLHRNSFSLEFGVWALDQLRVGFGYGITQSRALEGTDESLQDGFYVNFAAKADAILDLFRRKP
ncbi:MAG TPA: hypothetical protein VFW45_01780 [Candidatus Polarisedimenticolia bacterium]|nr:hypothetical protein [Candidatus Polarisedimenticolia bacterium]